MEDELKKTAEQDPERVRRAMIRGWIIVSGIALLFVIYGLFAFFVIGDNQPAEWDFGAVKDTPGESVYSTYPYRGRTEEPRPQHVDQKPPDAVTDPSDRALSSPPKRKPEPRKFQPEAELEQQSEQKVQHPGQPGIK